jgi:hypothetical protein
MGLSGVKTPPEWQVSNYTDYIFNFTPNAVAIFFVSFLTELTL